MSQEFRKALVLGHRGMLGHVVLRYLTNHGLATSTIDARYHEGDDAPFWAAINSLEPDVVINCIGLIKQKSSSLSDLLSLNAVFPLLLRLHLPPQVLLVQPSTDCVFAGDRGSYEASELPNATDNYGISKALGEAVVHYPNTLLIRSSVIGPELSGHYGLLAWFLSHPDGSRIQGYAHHRWNGITTLEWCNVLARALATRKEVPVALIQAGTERIYTKADVLRLLASTFDRDFRVDDATPGFPVDRSLKPSCPCRPLEVQLRDLLEWMNAIGVASGR